jgi:hypothetical protein
MSAPDIHGFKHLRDLHFILARVLYRSGTHPEARHSGRRSLARGICRSFDAEKQIPRGARPEPNRRARDDTSLRL